VENTDKLKVVPIDGGNGPQVPTHDTINDGSYSPLSRPLFIYVSSQSATREDVQTFVNFYLDNAATLAGEVGYVALPEKAYDLARHRFAKGVTGSVFADKESTVGLKLEDLLAIQ
jgi:phosphate transport system substrate-binding protein